MNAYTSKAQKTFSKLLTLIFVLTPAHNVIAKGNAQMTKTQDPVVIKHIVDQEVTPRFGDISFDTTYVRFEAKISSQRCLQASKDLKKLKNTKDQKIKKSFIQNLHLEQSFKQSMFKLLDTYKKGADNHFPKNKIAIQKASKTVTKDTLTGILQNIQNECTYWLDSLETVNRELKKI